jgi:predicted amino acid racemase
VQIPTAEAGAVAATRPEHWTVFNPQRAAQAGAAAKAVGYEQPLLARVVHERDRFYPGHEGGFPAGDILTTAQLLDDIDGARFAGVTTFPALLFDRATGKPRTTPNMQTLTEAAEALARQGRQDVQINAPGTTSVRTLSTLADAGATQVEPGHALTGTTPWHAVEDLPELPAVAYLTEVSHHHAGRAYCFGGGLYVDPVLGEYPTHTGALAGRDAGDLNPVRAELPPASAIDYYAQLDAPSGAIPAVGDSVVFGFRVQAFVTRAYVAPIRGISTGSPEVAGLWYTNGQAAGWPAL